MRPIRCVSGSPPNRPLQPAEQPIGADEARTLLAPLTSSRGVALAVSGGADSLALMVTAACWRESRADLPVHVLTVDHRLRPESGDEARYVAECAGSLGLSARRLVCTGPCPETGIEAAAREARYRLLFAAARDLGCDHLLTAHHRDDVAETFLMRLSRGSGVFGLAAMRERIDVDGLTLFRPFLDLPRSRLAATASAAGLAPVDDPMNRDPRFLRSRVRAALPVLDGVGLSPELLAEAARRLTAAAEAIDAQVDGVLRDGASVSPLGVVTLDAATVTQGPDAVRFRLMERVLTAAGGGDVPPRFAKLEALCAALADGDVPARTLGGALVCRRGARVTVCREPGRLRDVARPLAPGRSVLWDRRFEVEVQADGLALAVLGEEGLSAAGAGEKARSGPRAALLALPAVRRGGHVVAAPHLDGQGGAEATFREVVGDRLMRPPLFPALDNRGEETR